MSDERERRPYLDPKPGEHLPEKEVSTKAHQRLSVAADAIGATKRAIAHQGNQVPSLKATNMNSKYRLLVMRDALAQPCWEYTSEARQLANENPEAAIAAKADLAGGGNCGEHAWVAYHYLRQHAGGEKIQVSQQSGFDHAFVLIGDLTKDKDNEIGVSDPWPNNPTACLWEDHFAHCGRDQIIDHQSMVADGHSFKAAIAAGLKLTAYGEKMINKADTDAETKAQTDKAQENHFWDHDDTATPRYDYRPPAAGVEAPAPEAEQPAPERL